MKVEYRSSTKAIIRSEILSLEAIMARPHTHHLKPGYYYSKEATNELWKVDEEFKIWIVLKFN